GMDGLPRACCDPSAAYDSVGNLFFAYLNAVNGRIEMLVSTDNGQNFTYLTEFAAEGDQPTVATGPGTVWVAFQREDSGAIAYRVYTDETPDESNNTDVFLRYSDNDGQSWSPPTRVNDDSTLNSQFFPRIAVDPVTGNVAVSWYDARNDTGVTGNGSKDLVAN